MRLPDTVRNIMTKLLEKDAKERSVQPPKENAEPPLSPALEEWLLSATSQMRWKRARPQAARELESHLSEQYEAFQEDGMDEDAAVSATLKEMGDPIETGTRLDRAWRPEPDFATLGFVLLFAAAGMVIQYLFRVPGGLSSDVEWYVFALKYLLGAGVLLGAYFLDYTLLGRYGKTLYKIWLLGGIFIALNPLTNMEVNGVIHNLAQWICWFPMVFAGFLYTQRGKDTTGIRNCALAIASMYALCIAARHATGLMLSMAATSCILLVCAVRREAFGKSTKQKVLLALSPVLIGAAALLFTLYAEPYKDNKSFTEWIYIMLHPTTAPDSFVGFHGSLIQHVLFNATVPEDVAAASERYMREVYDNVVDFLLVKVKFEWGWIASALILAALAVLLVRGLLITRRQSGLLGWCVSLTAVLTLTFETVMYLICNCGILLFGAHGLPLFSYGGLYLCQTMFLIGMLLSARRMGKLEPGTRSYCTHPSRTV